MSDGIYTTDWSASITYWPNLFAELELIGKPDLHFLEIGCFEGRTTRWLLENVLTHPMSSITVVDLFSHDGQLDRFERNLSGWIDTPKLHMVVDSSYAALSEMNVVFADFVYIDGDHRARQVLEDAVLAWRLLKPSGILIFDDYDWPQIADDEAKPTIAADAFIACYASEIDWTRHGGKDQLIVRKRLE